MLKNAQNSLTFEIISIKLTIYFTVMKQTSLPLKAKNQTSKNICFGNFFQNKVTKLKRFKFFFQY